MAAPSYREPPTWPSPAASTPGSSAPSLLSKQPGASSIHLKRDTDKFSSMTQIAPTLHGKSPRATGAILDGTIPRKSEAGMSTGQTHPKPVHQHMRRNPPI